MGPQKKRQQSVVRLQNKSLVVCKKRPVWDVFLLLEFFKISLIRRLKKMLLKFIDNVLKLNEY